MKLYQIFFIISTSLASILDINQQVSNQTFITLIKSDSETIELIYQNEKMDRNQSLSCYFQNCSCDSIYFDKIICQAEKNVLEFLLIKQQFEEGDLILNDGQQIISQSPQNRRERYLSKFLPSARLAQQTTFVSNDMQSSLNISTIATMSWKYNGDGTFDMIFEWPKLSWVGMGFCPTMSNCDMMVLNLVDNAVVIIDTYSTGHSTPSTDQSQDIMLVSQVVTSTGYKVRFNRKLNTGDKEDQILKKGDSYTFCLAYSGSQTMQMHDNDGTFTFTFDVGQFGTVAFIEGKSVLFYLHAIILFLAWGIVADVGIIIGRFYKDKQTYLNLHAYCFIFVDLSTIVLVILMLTIGESEGEDASLELHAVLSFILLIAVCLQHIMGFVAKVLLEQTQKKNNSYVINMKLVHAILGSILYILAKIDMIFGFIYNDSGVLLLLYIIWVVLLLLARAYLEYNKNKLSVIKYQIQPQANQLTQDQLNLMEMLNSNKPTEMIKNQYPNLLWVMFNQDVFDFTNYQHPGGNFILKHVQGREISRFFFGAFGLECTSMKPYAHSQQAYKALMNHYIGTLGNSLFKESASPRDRNDYTWNIENKIQLTNDIIQFEFSQQNTKLNLSQNVSELGRHFSLSLQPIGSKTRMYTKVMCMSPPVVKYRENCIKFYEQFLLGQQSQVPQLEQSETDTLPLIIKRYKYPNALSAELFNYNGSKVYIQGPFGRGLELEQVPNGIGFVGGTGILPLLDLLDYLLMKSIYLVINQKNSDLAKRFFNKNEQMNDNFQFKLFASFINEDEFIGKEWIRWLHKINQDHNLQLFKMEVRYSNKSVDPIIPTFQQRFNVEFVNKQITGDQTVFICGPPIMYEQLIKILQETKQDQNKIVLI